MQLSHASLILPELFQLGIILILFLQVLFSAGGKNAHYWLVYGAFLNVMACGASLRAQGVLFSGAYLVDPISQLFKLIVAIGYFFVILNALRHPTLEEAQKTDYFLLLSLSAWGTTLMASTVELMTLFIALELTSYTLYAIIPLRSRHAGSAEAAIKYLIFGALFTALGLFGFFLHPGVPAHQLHSGACGQIMVLPGKSSGGHRPDPVSGGVLV